MKKIIIFSILLLSAIAVTVGTTITTTIQIQPAYSQASHCQPATFPVQRCITPGQNPSFNFCSTFGPLTCGPPRPIEGDNPHQEAGQFIGDCDSIQGLQCTVRPPNQ